MFPSTSASHTLMFDLTLGDFDDMLARLEQLRWSIPRRALHDTFEKAAQRVKEALLQPTMLWRRGAPDIEVELKWYERDDFEFVLTINDNVYVWLVRGTARHTITPNGPWPLRFRSSGPGSYSRVTRVGSLLPRPGTRAEGLPQVAAYVVDHPGTQATKWDVLAVERVQPTIVPEALRAVEAELKRTVF